MRSTYKYTPILGLVILILTSCFSTAAIAQTINEQERVYVKIEIKGMACPFCAFGLEKKLKKVTGVKNVEIELRAGLAYISTPIKQKPTKESLAKIITDAGFTVGNIEFSNTPFIRNKDENE